MVIGVTTSSSVSPSFLHSLQKYGSVVIFQRGQSINNQQKQAIDVLLASPSYFEKIDAKVLHQFPRLKVVIAMSSGTDWIDQKELAISKIKLFTAQGASATSVAEHSWAMAFMLARKLSLSFFEKNFSFQDYQGIQISNKSIGILGFGHVGQAIHKIAQGITTSLFALNSPTHHPDTISTLSLSEICATCDLIFLALPLTDQTKKIINQECFAHMKPSAILINCAREELVEFTSMEEAILSHRIAGYGVDVTSSSLANYHQLMATGRVIASPHTAFFTPETKQQIEMKVLKTLQHLTASLNTEWQ